MSTCWTRTSAWALSTIPLLHSSQGENHVKSCPHVMLLWMKAWCLMYQLQTFRTAALSASFICKTWALCFPAGDRGVNAEDPTHPQCDRQTDDDQETADGTGGGDCVRESLNLLKGQFHQKWMFCHHWLTIMPLKTWMLICLRLEFSASRYMTYQNLNKL